MCSLYTTTCFRNHVSLQEADLSIIRNHPSFFASTTGMVFKRQYRERAHSFQSTVSGRLIFTIYPLYSYILMNIPREEYPLSVNIRNAP